MGGQRVGLRVGIDIGGTFTDLAILDDTGIVAVGKTLTTREPAAGVEAVLRRTLAEHRLDAGDIGSVVHGTTLVTNALIERRGPRTALLTTEGFRDVLEMGREHRYELYDLDLELPRPLVPRHLRFGVRERLLADGTVGTPLDVAAVERLAVELAGAGVEAVAVCFLHSHVDGAHERRAREVVAAAAPGLRVALSCEVNPEIREYERFSTTVANVYVQALAERYLADLRDRLRRLGVRVDPLIMLSSGGVATVPTAARFPIRMLESGPAGGALGAVAFGRSGNRPNQLAFDMGGTTAKMCVIERDEPLVTHTLEVDRVYRLRPGSGLPVRAPVIDMIEIGTGGGSIARVDPLGLITTGPDSAGSDPGPVCYGLGGKLATVTDADLVLGYLDREGRLGGEVPLDLDAAAEAIREQIAAPLGLDLAEAAWGIHTTANQNMANAARVHAVERGQDPGRLPLFVSGGNGPLHGPGVARALGSPLVVAPPAAGVLSALGMLAAPLSIDTVRSWHVPLAELTVERARELFAELEGEGSAVLRDSGLDPDAIAHQRSLEMRFAGQGSEIEVPVPEFGPDWVDAAAAGFHRQYATRFGVAPAGVPIEVLTWRVSSRGPRPRARLRFAGGAHGSAEPVGYRDAYFPDTGYVRTACYERTQLAPGTRLSGPALVQERDSTLVVPPDARCTVAEDGTLLLELSTPVVPGATPVVPSERSVRSNLSSESAVRSEGEVSGAAEGAVDPVLVGLVANRLHALLNEQQAALVHTAFSPVVRECYDLACGVFDSRGEMVGQSIGGTPGHINAMATGMRHIVAKYPATELADGDVLITNDPWLTAGQINDLTVATPVFRAGALVGWFASCCHSPDIGGRLLSAAATEVFEEGLRLPIMKLRTAAGPDPTLEALIRANVRTPDETMGDVYAQVAANQVGARGLLAMLAEFELESLDPVAAQIMDRSEAAVRAALRELPDGCYRAEMRSDGFGGEPLDLRVAVTIDGDRAHIDHAGSSPQSRYGVNVVLNYTRAYTSFAVKAALAPDVPHNAGSFRPVTVTAPEGSVLNCVDPAPVASRHLVGHFLPSLLFDALRDAVPGGLPAASADALWMMVWRGADVGEPRPFTLTTFSAGGTGARPGKDGLNTTGFPTGVRAVPTEVLETLTPLVQRRRELRPDSGGAGRFRGGLGQVLEMTRRGGHGWTVNANVDRVHYPAPGARGGGSGSPGGLVELTGRRELPGKQLVRLDPDAHVRLVFPGGGGYGDPTERPVAAVLDDVVDGYLGVEAARRDHGVDVEYLGDPDAVVRPARTYRVREVDPRRG